MNNDNLFECDNNHIYFYCDVNNKSCLLLNTKIKELNNILLKQSIDFDIKPVNIYLHINSGGGSLFAAFSTIDTIINSQVPIISIIEGAAASAATLISIVCHERFITENSYMLIHQLSSFNKGKYEEMKDEFLNDTKLMKLLYKLYYEHTTMKLYKIKKILKQDIWLDYNDCIKYGLVDKVYYNKNKIIKKIRDSNKIKHKLYINLNEKSNKKKRLI